MAATATSLDGFRAKALAVLWEARPAHAEATDFDFNDDDNGGAARALCYAVAEMTGLVPMVRELEARLST